MGAFNSKKADFTELFSLRVAGAKFENCDACKIIQTYDVPDSFFYTDPPYVGADQGHYAGYTQKHFDALLETLASIRGKFLLSSYPNDGLSALMKKHGWYQVEVKMNNSMVSAELGHLVVKTEVLTANYHIDKRGGCAPSLFGGNSP